LDYEITIQCRTNLPSQSFSFGLVGLDSNLNIFDLRKYDDSENKNFFLESVNFNNESYNKIRGIIYNKNFGRLWSSVSKYRKGEILKHNDVLFLCIKQNTNITTSNTQYWQQLSSSDFETNIGAGNQLKFPVNSGINRILPIFVLDNRLNYTLGGEIFICDIKIRPLVNGNFANQQELAGASSNCFLHLKNFTTIYFKNNNHKKSTEEINSIAERYLFPYNFVSKQILL
jgi:hypothetical protein